MALSFDCTYHQTYDEDAWVRHEESMERYREAEQEGAANIAFYQSGTCRCGHSRGSHDWPNAQCMESPCLCEAFREALPQHEQRTQQAELFPPEVAA